MKRDEGLLHPSDEYSVDYAEKRLVELLSTPYYHEAYLRLLRKRHPVVANRAGILPRKGTLAANYQFPAPVKLGKRGRKPIERPVIARLVDIAELRGWPISSLCLAFLGVAQYGADAQLSHRQKVRLKEDAKRLAQQVRNYKKKLRGNKSP